MNRAWYISPRPAGDFAVQKVVEGRVIRWGVFATEAEATAELRLASAL